MFGCRLFTIRATRMMTTCPMTVDSRILQPSVNLSSRLCSSRVRMHQLCVTLLPMDTGWNVLSGTTVDSSSDVVIPTQTCNCSSEADLSNKCELDCTLIVRGGLSFVGCHVITANWFVPMKQHANDDACHIHYSYRLNTSEHYS